MLGVSKQRVHQLLASGRFPRPVARLSAGLFWDRADIERWIKANRPG